MADTYNPNDNAQLKHVAALAQVTKNKLDELDAKNFGGVSIADGKINFFATNDTTKAAIASVDLPEELFLDQVRTTFVPNFVFSAASYPGATNPDLDGKPVLVLAIKGDKATDPTLTYSFINLEKLVDPYTAQNAAISVAGYSIGVKLSADSGNILSIAPDGLKGEMKVAGASAGNFAIFGASGAIVDSGFTVAPDADVINMLNGIFGAGSISSI